jgi:GMP synthase-like glutamine amidotransferase
MLLLINNTVKSNTAISSVPKLKLALRTLNMGFYEVKGPKIHPEVFDPTGPIFRNITGIIISGSSMKLTQIGTDISKYVHILHYLRAFQHVPVLGICFGAQLLLTLYGGALFDNRKYTSRSVPIQVLKTHKLFRKGDIRPPKTPLRPETTLRRTRAVGFEGALDAPCSNTVVASFNFSDIPIMPPSSRKVKPIAWVNGNTTLLAVAYEFERDRVYGCLFHPELNPDTYYIIKNVFG